MDSVGFVQLLGMEVISAQAEGVMEGKTLKVRNRITHLVHTLFLIQREIDNGSVTIVLRKGNEQNEAAES